MNPLEVLIVAIIIAIIVDVLLAIAIGRYLYKKSGRVHFESKRKPQKGWTNVINPKKPEGVVEVHTLPSNDLVPHEWEDCACGPQTIPQERSDGSLGWQVVHNAMDGRP